MDSHELTKMDNASWTRSARDIFVCFSINFFFSTPPSSMSPLNQATLAAGVLSFFRIVIEIQS